MIDVSFTPLHLVAEAQRIVSGRLCKDEQPDHWIFAEARVLKGAKKDSLRISLDLPTVAESADARTFLRACVGEDAALFEAKYPGGEIAGLLLVRNVWMRLTPAAEGGWRIGVFDDQRMLKTYSGAADKLIAMAEYLLNDEDADVPVAVGVEWRKQVHIARFPSPPTGIASLPSERARGALLFVASMSGDRLFAYDEAQERFRDLTEMSRLDTASQAFALCDLNGDGQTDLASWDGKHLRIRTGLDGGGLAPLSNRMEPEWEGPCGGLAPLSPSQDGSPGLLISAPWPHALARKEGRWQVVPLPGEPAQYAPAGADAPCIAADWDVDGYADVLQLREKESLLWKGKKRGFEEPKPCGITIGPGPVRWCLGDFDMDGLLDLFVSGPETNELWENAGGGVFRAVLQYSGSLQYKLEPGAADCLATDLNHDGRPDLALFYRNGHFLYHFNRGFRCMAEEATPELIAESPDRREPGARCPVRVADGDFNADGSSDLAVAFESGEIVCFFSKLTEKPSLRLRLPRGRTGPITVSVWQGSPRAFCVGTYSVAGHAPPTCASLRNQSPHTLKWRLPGGREEKTRVEPSNRSVDIGVSDPSP